jgi:hypothetical protein
MHKPIEMRVLPVAPWLAVLLALVMVAGVAAAQDDEDFDTGDEDDDVDLSYDDDDDDDIDDEEDEPEKPAKKSKKGTLVVEILGEETAKVFIDGMDVGETDWEDEILPGIYKVEVKKPGMPAWKGKVPVKKGKETVVSVNLEGKGKGPATSPMFWATLGVAVPTLATGIAFTALSSGNNSEAGKLSRQLDAGVWAADPILQAEKAQEQNDLVEYSDQQMKTAIAMYVISGLATGLAVVSLFIFQKEKPAAEAHIEVSSVTPVIDPESGTVGVGIGGTF